jgi:glucokinase
MKNHLYLIGLDLGGTAIKYGVCDNNGVIKKEFISETKSDDPVDLILKKIRNSISEALRYVEKEKVEISAIGLGTPGCVNISNGYLGGNTPNFKYWRNVGIKGYLTKYFDIPIFIDNDANAMAFGEFSFGAGKNYNDLICITLGTGIGGGIIINKRLFRGSKFAGAELGHMSIHYNGKKCSCGGIGCWELYASATALIENYISKNSTAKSITIREIFKQYKNGDELAVEVVQYEVEMLATGLANLVNIFNPERIIIGGGLSQAGQWFIDKVKEAVKKKAMKESLNSVEILPAELGNKAGWLGAAALAYHQCLSHK